MKVSHRGGTIIDDGGIAAPALIAPLRWRCRRGMKELDVLLERFAQQVLPRASPAECRVYAELLALPDPLLAGYLLGGEPPAESHLARTGQVPGCGHHSQDLGSAGHQPAGGSAAALKGVAPVLKGRRHRWFTLSDSFMKFRVRSPISSLG